MRLLVSVLCAIMLATATFASSGKPTVYRIDVWVDHDECQIAVEGQKIPKAQLLGRLKQLPDKSAEIHVRAKIDAPYRCVGGAIVHAQKAGFQRVGFISVEAED